MQSVPGWLSLRELNEGQSEVSYIRYADVQRVSVKEGRNESEVDVLVQALGQTYLQSRYENKREADNAAMQILRDVQGIK